MSVRKTLPAAAVAACGTVLCQHAISDVTIQYNEYSDSATIGRGAGTSIDPTNPGYGAMRIFIQKVMDYTDDTGSDALPVGQKVIFQRNQSTGRAVNALRAGVQFANANAVPNPTTSDPSWGLVYNSVPFGINFVQMLGFLYDAKIEGFGGNGIALAQSILDSRGATQVVFPVVGSTMQGSGYFPRPIGKPDCIADDTDCINEGNGTGLRSRAAVPDSDRHADQLLAKYRPDRRAICASSVLASTVPAVMDARRQDRLERFERCPESCRAESRPGIRDRILQRY